MKFTNGGKLNVTQQVVLSGGFLDESNTDIVTALLFMNNIQNSATPTYLKNRISKIEILFYLIRQIRANLLILISIFLILFITFLY